LSRGHKILVALILFAIIWSVAFVLTSKEKQKDLHFTVKALPGYLLIVFGCFALYSIGSGLFFLNDYPEEQASLLKDIDRAREFLKSKKAIL